MEPKILDFIKTQHIASMSCLDDQGLPYSFNCMYVYQETENFLYFKSGAGTQHARLLKKNPIVSGTILPDKLNLLIVKGVQFWGHLIQESELRKGEGFKYYHKQLPMAFVRPGDIFVIALDTIKMMDASHGIIKKYSWSRAAAASLTEDKV